MRYLSARAYSDVAIEVHIGDTENPQAWGYELSLNQDRQRRLLIKRERVVKDGEVLLNRPDKADEIDQARLTQTYLEQINANQKFREVATFFSSIRYLHIVPQLVREPERSVGKTDDPFGGDFLEQIASEREQTQKARLKRIVNALTVAVPLLTELDLWRDDRGVPHLRGKYKNWREKGVWITEDRLSDGTLRLMGLLWAILDGRGPLLLEEPELSLHPEVVRLIPQMFARAQNRLGRQILISTHSRDLLSDPGIDPKEALLLQLNAEGGTSIRPADMLENTADLLEGHLSLAEVVIPATRPPGVEKLPLFPDL